jgi:hypothetical protein
VQLDKLPCAAEPRFFTPLEANYAQSSEGYVAYLGKRGEEFPVYKLKNIPQFSCFPRAFQMFSHPAKMAFCKLKAAVVVIAALGLKNVIATNNGLAITPQMGCMSTLILTPFPNNNNNNNNNKTNQPSQGTIGTHLAATYPPLCCSKLPSLWSIMASKTWVTTM